MDEFGEFDQHFPRIGARVVPLFSSIAERVGDIAAHHRLEQVDGAAAVGEAEHLAHVVAADRRAGAMGDRLVEQRQRVADRAFRRAGDQRQRLGFDFDLLLGGDRREMVISFGLDAAQVEALAARPHGDRHLVDLGGRKQEFHVRRRFFQRLEQAVEGAACDSMCTSSMI